MKVKQKWKLNFKCGTFTAFESRNLYAQLNGT